MPDEEVVSSEVCCEQAEEAAADVAVAEGGETPVADEAQAEPCEASECPADAGAEPTEQA
ncbi:MAG: hypothetical protein ACM3ZC_14935 [Bacteroidota bacterium]